MYCVYLLRCSDDSFSVGSTKNVGGRVRTHDSGRRATYTFKRRLVRLMYTEVFDTETQAIKRERQLKRWSATKKQTLIAGKIEKLRSLSKRRASGCERSN
jgi:putative endonuclease